MPDKSSLTLTAEDYALPQVQLVDEPALPAAAPGRAVGGREAGAMLADVGGAADPRLGAMVGAIPMAEDEIDGATAAALKARHSRRADEAALLDGDVAEVRPMIGVDVEKHRNLPDVIRKSVLGIDYDENAAPLPVVPRWLAVYDLPGYMVEPIRALGRTTFKTFPCFRTHDAAAKAAGEDPLGSMRILANLQGRGPTPQGELDAMANWIRKNGVPVEAGHVEFPIAIPGYSPRIILAGNETTSFLMVDEKRADGAPVDAQYIYAWAGGRSHYLANPQDLAHISGPSRRQVVVQPPNRPGRRIAGPAVEEAALANIARLSSPFSGQDGISDAAKRQARRAIVKALPVAQDENPDIVMNIRRAGFRPDGPQSEMRLKRAEGDGRTSILTRNPDFATGAFLLVVTAEDGCEMLREAVNDVDAIEIVVNRSAPRP